MDLPHLLAMLLGPVNIDFLNLVYAGDYASSQTLLGEKFDLIEFFGDNPLELIANQQSYIKVKLVMESLLDRILN